MDGGTMWRMTDAESDAGAAAAAAAASAGSVSGAATASTVAPSVAYALNAMLPIMRCACTAVLSPGTTVCRGPQGILPPHQPCSEDTRVIGGHTKVGTNEKNFPQEFLEWLKLQPVALQALPFNSKETQEDAATEMRTWTRSRLFLVTWHCGFWGQYLKTKQNAAKSCERKTETHLDSLYVAIGGKESHPMRDAINFLITLIPMCKPNSFIFDAKLLMGDGNELAKKYFGCPALLGAGFPASLLRWVLRFQEEPSPTSYTAFFCRELYNRMLLARLHFSTDDVSKQHTLLGCLDFMLQHSENIANHANWSAADWQCLMWCLCRDGIWLPPLAECDFSSVRAFIVQMFLFNRKFERAWMEDMYTGWSALAARIPRPTVASLWTARQVRVAAKAAKDAAAAASASPQASNANPNKRKQASSEVNSRKGAKKQAADGPSTAAAAVLSSVDSVPGSATLALPHPPLHTSESGQFASPPSDVQAGQPSTSSLSLQEFTPDEQVNIANSCIDMSGPRTPATHAESNEFPATMHHDIAPHDERHITTPEIDFFQPANHPSFAPAQPRDVSFPGQ